ATRQPVLPEGRIEPHVAAPPTATRMTTKERNMHRKRTLQRLATSLGGLALLGICGTSAPAQVLTKTITYTRFSGPPDNVKRVQFTYNAGTATVAFGPRITITSTPGADG